MGAFSGMEELLTDFLLEAGELLSDVDSKLMTLEKQPSNTGLLNEIFRGFHTIKGGAGFLNAHELVNVCHLTENLFDKLRNKEMALNADLMDVIFNATQEVNTMFGALRSDAMPLPAPSHLIENLKLCLDGKKPNSNAANTTAGKLPVESNKPTVDWDVMFAAINPNKNESVIAADDGIAVKAGRRADDSPGSTVGRREGDSPVKEAKETTIRVDTDRLDQVLNLSGEIGLAKNRLNHLRSDILQGRNDAETLRDLDQSVTQLDMLVVNLQNAVMKTRMQPIGRLFKKYPRLARDLARSLNKDVEMVLIGEETEMDKTMIEDLNDPLVHLVRNAVDHGVESVEDRLAAGKSAKSFVELSARQEGDHILITISDDGAGMRPEAIRSKAIEKGLITNEVANTLDEEQCLNLIFMPGFSTKETISSVSGRGVGMDVVKTNIQRLNGTVSIKSVVGKGSVFTISLPLTLAILPVLILRLADQSFAVPLSMVREILPVEEGQLQKVSGRSTMVVRGEVLPVLPLSKLVGWAESDKYPEVGVLMHTGHSSFILSADGFAGHDDVVIKSLETFRPKGVAGVTMSSEGDIVLILDIKELLEDVSSIR